VKTLAIIFWMISFFNAIIAWLPPSFLKAKNLINQRFLNICIKFNALNDDELALAVRPVILWGGASIFMLTVFLIQLWGKNDRDAKELSLTWFVFFCFYGLSLITTQEFMKRFKMLFNHLVKITLWVTGTLAVFTIITVSCIVSLKASADHQPVSSEQFTQGIVDVMKLFAFSGGLAFLKVAAITLLILIAIPFILRKAFLIFVRRVINFIIKKEQKDPIKVPLVIISIFFFLLSLYAYFNDKLTPH